MSKTAIIYWSGTGNTQTMAMSVLDGARKADPDTDFFSVSEITADAAAAYDNLLLGCPAMGAEVLEESEFEPFFTELEAHLSGKNVGLFGSYGWGDGEWMRSWEDRVRDAGATLVGGEGVIANEAPDEDAQAACEKLGEAVAAL